MMWNIIRKIKLYLKNWLSFFFHPIFLTSIIFLAAIVFLIQQNKTPSTTDKRDEQIPQELEATYAYQAMWWYNFLRAHPTGTIPLDWREKANNHISTNNLTKQGAHSLSWKSVGPNNIGGRIRSIAIHPSNPQIIYCGSVSGGVWKTTNGGLNWFPVSDFAANIAIGALAIDPKYPNIIYAGTGEGYFNIDALRGAGVLKSTDEGATWTQQTNFLNAVNPYYYYFINKLIINPHNTNILYAALIGGIWKTTNGGSSWSKLNVNTESTACVDLVMDPTDSNILYAAFGLFRRDGVYKTTNGGTSWFKLTNGFPTTGYGRISLGISPSNPLILYASLSDSADHYTHSIQKTTNGGASWFAVQTPYDNSPEVNGTHLGGQGWYNNVIAVHPTNPQIVIAGGINLFKSTDGGTTWNRISDGYRHPYVHVDQHVITFHPFNSSTIYFGTDGGVFRSTDGGSNFTELNNGLVTVQFYSGAVHPTQDIYYGGTQDNGTLKSGLIPAWSMVLGGDGGATAVDYINPSTVYTEYVYLSVYKSTNSGMSWEKKMNGIPPGNPGTSDRCAFIAPITMDPTDPKILVAGTYRVFRTTNGANSWSPISEDLTGSGSGSVGSPGSVITAIAIAKSSSATIYIGTSGYATVRSKVQVTTNTGVSWIDITKDTLPNRAITAIAIDQTNSSRAFITFSGYSANTQTRPGHVYMTTNRGSTWVNVSGNLPDIPVNTIVLHPTNTNHIVIGTDLGIFETLNGGTTWIQQNNGMANVSVADIDLRSDGFLFAATHGRGMFKLSDPWGIVIPSDTIYPGDTNNDSLVDARDLLPIARYYGVSGSPRINPSLQWTPQNLSGPFSPIEAAYADCNGNGTVEKTDVLGLIHNWYNRIGTPATTQPNQILACEELLNSLNDISTSGPLKEMRTEIIRYRSQLLNIPNEWRLEQNYPNPFNPSTTINFSIPIEANFVKLMINDVNGRILREFIFENVLPGYNNIEWDGTNSEGVRVASGIYYYTLIANDIKLTKKMVLIR